MLYIDKNTEMLYIDGGMKTKHNAAHRMLEDIFSEAGIETLPDTRLLKVDTSEKCEVLSSLTTTGIATLRFYVNQKRYVARVYLSKEDYSRLHKWVKNEDLPEDNQSSPKPVVLPPLPLKPKAIDKKQRKTRDFRPKPVSINPHSLTKRLNSDDRTVLERAIAELEAVVKRASDSNVFTSSDHANSAKADLEAAKARLKSLP